LLRIPTESRERTVPTGTLMTFATSHRTCLQARRAGSSGVVLAAACRERLQARGLSLAVAGDLVYVTYIVEMTAVDDFRKCDPNSTMTRLEWILGFHGG